MEKARPRLTAHLEVQPLLEEVLLWRTSVCQLASLVILIDKIFVDRARFPQSDARVGVFNGGNTSIGVGLCEWLLLHVAHLNKLGCVWNAELFENDDNLPVKLVSSKARKCLRPVGQSLTMGWALWHGCRV